MPDIVSASSTYLLWGVIAYLIGSIPFGMILARVMGLGNLRDIGSGNIGAISGVVAVSRWQRCRDIPWPFVCVGMARGHRGVSDVVGDSRCVSVLVTCGFGGRHAENIRRLVAGEESKIGSKGEGAAISP